MAEPRRVALLARPGEACERLRAAVGEAGGAIVLEGDPTALGADALAAASPEVVLVALDPTVEDALDRFDAVLADPAIDVIYDEAELAARREGWDAARWIRHLAAKLHSHDDVLPPGREPEQAMLPQPGRPATPEERHADAPFAPFADEALDFVADVPADTLAEPLPEPVVAAEPSAVSLGGLQFTDDINEMDFEPSAPAASAPAFDGLLEFDAMPAFDTMPAFDAAPALEAAPSPDAGLEFDAGLELDAAPALDAALDMSLDFDATPAPAAGPDFDSPLEFDAAPAFAPALADPALDFAAPAAAEPDAAEPAAAEPAPRFQRDLADLERRIAAMELVDAPAVAPAAASPAPATTTAAARGAVLILAGIGGPDAVRQVLAGLPEGFPRPLLISQRLDGGRYDRLVQQMSRATSLPVQLAESGTVATPGQVYIVPPELGVAAADRGLRFVADAALLQALPADDSAVLLLSGTDPAEVDAALAQAAQGALVAGQSPDGCYDGAASNALVARGGIAASPAELVQQLLQRWSPTLAS